MNHIAEIRGEMTKQGREKYRVLSVNLRKWVFMALIPQLLSNKESFIRTACKWHEFYNRNSKLVF